MVTEVGEIHRRMSFEMRADYLVNIWVSSPVLGLRPPSLPVLATPLLHFA